MLFKDKLDEKTKIIRPEIDKLLDIAWKNQNHFGDMLLIHFNGFFQEDILQYNNHAERKLNPHVIGPGSAGHSEHAHYMFIHKYRTTNIVKQTHKEYLEEIKWSSEKRKQIDDLTAFEEMTIQLEILIYLKFWEADMIIKRLYQFVIAMHKENYDWYFKIAESPGDKNHSGTRQEIIRLKIRDRIKQFSIPLYQVLKDSYKTQIRNSIAHSNYSFLGRNIHINNYIKEDPHAQMKGLDFDNWIDIFHNTIVLYNEYIRMNKLINKHYAQIAFENGNTIEIRVTEKDGKSYPLYVEYRPEWKDWKYKQEKSA